MVQANTAITDQARNGTGCAIVHSDDAIGIQHLNQEASKHHLQAEGQVLKYLRQEQ